MTCGCAQPLIVVPGGIYRPDDGPHRAQGSEGQPRLTRCGTVRVVPEEVDLHGPHKESQPADAYRVGKEPTAPVTGIRDSHGGEDVLQEPCRNRAPGAGAGTFGLYLLPRWRLPPGLDPGLRQGGEIQG
jgi:hypothetical protein